MDPDAERWQVVQEIFEAVREESPGARASMLEAACGADESLRQEVASLLESYEAEGPLDRLARSLGGLEGEGMASGATVGPYRVVRELGRGGMGVVYLAERADGQFERQVALKLVRYTVGSEDLKDRFLNERQILARLQHPNIARLLDGGVTPDGQAWFAMEYVDGEPLDEYCDRRRLDIDERLDLFVDVAEAVHHAHQSLIVHRDLKPGNVLVGSDGTVRLLDFGIAKVVEDADAATGLTRPGLRLMTPEYAAPEQVRGEPVTTASDVYQLGVLLYDLLTGRGPYRQPAATPAELERVICDEEPTRPSAVVAAGGPELAQSRRTDAGRLGRRLAGDLDTIILKALRKEPSRRYASAHALVDDIRRHRAGLPVTARPDTVGYRARKFVRRHRVGAAASLLVSLSLVGGLGAALWQARVAAGERDRARLEAAKAEQVSAFLVDMFAAPDPGVARGREVTARAVLDAGAARIERELAGQPEVRAEAMTVMGQVYRNLGEYDRGQALLEEALAVRRASRDPTALAETLHQLGVLYGAKRETGAAEPLLAEAVAIRRAQIPASPTALAASLHELAWVVRTAGRPGESEALYREALAVAGTTSPTTLFGLATTLHDQGRYDEAEAAFEQVAALHRTTAGPPHPDVASSLMALGQFRHFRGDLEAAEPLYRETLDMRRTLYGDAHPDVADVLVGLASLLTRASRYAEAEGHSREALGILEAAHGPEHHAVAVARQNLGTLLREAGDYVGAEAELSRALAVFRTDAGEGRNRVVVTLNDLGMTYLASGDLDAAMATFTESIAEATELHGSEHPYIAVALNRQGQIEHRRGNLEEAERHYLEALEMGRRLLRPEHSYLTRFEADLERLREERGSGGS